MERSQNRTAPDRRVERAWGAAQAVLWAAGLTELVLLLVWPRIGLHALWNVLIPLAPAVFVFLPGLWRNVCPLATTALLPRRLGLSRRGEVHPRLQGIFEWLAVALLLLIVPLRHVTLDTSGPSTAAVLGGLALVALAGGALFEWKSGWCSGLCPVVPVERLYGWRPLATLSNARCSTCVACVRTCSDSLPAPHPLGRNGGSRAARTLMVGGFAGFIWGWFHVPNYVGGAGWAHLVQVYGPPLTGMSVTLTLYLALSRALPPWRLPAGLLERFFALAAVACYYWYRLPALVGFAPYPGDGALVDLTSILPPGFLGLSHLATTALLAAWMLTPTPAPRSWTHRPPLAQAPSRTTSPSPHA